MNATNPPLLWYSATALDDVEDDLRSSNAAADDTFRDSSGRWWQFRPGTGWVVHDTGRWVPEARPHELEGPAIGPVPAPHSTDGGSGDLDELAATDGLIRAVDLTTEAYRSGHIGSTMAELLLSRRVVVSGDSRVWTFGALSRCWYAYGTTGWQREPTAPEGPFLTGFGALSAVAHPGSSVRRWLETGPLLPEGVTPLWNPPEGRAGASVISSATAPLEPALAPLPPPHPSLTPSGTPIAPEPAPTDRPSPVLTTAKLLLLAGALVGALSAFLPWFTPDDRNRFDSFQLSASILLSGEIRIRTGLSLGVLVLALAVTAGIAALVRTRASREVAALAGFGSIVTVVVFTGRLIRAWSEWTDDPISSVGSGPVVAFVAGVVVLVTAVRARDRW